MPLATSLRHSDLKGSLYALSTSLSVLNKTAQKGDEFINKDSPSTNEERVNITDPGEENAPSCSILSAESGSALSPKFLFSPSTSSKQSNDLSISLQTFCRTGGDETMSANMDKLKRRLSVISTCVDDAEDHEHHRGGSEQHAHIVGPKLTESPSGSVQSNLSVTVHEVSFFLFILLPSHINDLHFRALLKH